MPVMAYSPLGGPGATLLGDPMLARVAAAHDCTSRRCAGLDEPQRQRDCNL
jgi:hypothetical protein